MRGWGPLAILAVATLAGCTVPLETQRVDLPSVRFVPGEDSASPFVESFTLAPDASSFGVVVRVASDARLDVDALVRLVHAGVAPHQVNVTATTASSPSLREYALDLRDARGEVVATLDLLSPAPRAQLRLAPGDALAASLRVSLSPHAATHEVEVLSTIAIEVGQTS